ncbi:MAG: biotin--[Oscillospiraceae bacterium]|nr:biotin--[acetyl-CoA-carboxylase] ligase [Oscillospiraceae bacterium]
MIQSVLANIPTPCPWRDTVYWYDTIDSTNTRAKELAKAGAPHGTVIIAGNQTEGRGRLGRSFSSPDGMGVYLSVILRPGCTPDKLMHLTCAAGVAAMAAVEAISGVCPDIKWANDLVLGSKKLGGILTELGFAGNRVDYAIVGIGINCCQRAEDFPEELQDIATSLLMHTGKKISPAILAAALTEQLFHMDWTLFSEKEQLMETYRRHCITLGKEIVVIQNDQKYAATAFDIDKDGGLMVRFADGFEKVINFGEVSVRGLCGYL